MASNIASFLAWSFLPDFVTNNLHSFYYSLTIRAGDRKPQPGTPTYAKHRRRIYTAVILGYLAYTLFEADWEIRRARDFYQLLGVPHDVDEKALQSRFRRLTLQHHPDKISASDTASRSAAEQYYVQLKLARDTLLDPAKRFAYDRFGPDMTQWQRCVTIRDYLAAGVQSVGGYYLGSAIFMVIFSWLGFFEWGSYWRYLAFFSLLSFETTVLTRPTPPALTARLLNPALRTLTLNTHPTYLPFQTLQLARKAILALFIALTRLGPVLAQSADTAGPPLNSPAGKEYQLVKLERITTAMLAESQRLMALEVVPFQKPGGEAEEVAGDEAGGAGRAPTMALVRAKLREWFVQNAVRSDREVTETVARVLEKNREAGERTQQ